MPLLKLAFVKNPKSSKTEETVIDDVKVNFYTNIVCESAKTVAKYVAIGVAGYIALDTVRQCAVKVTPQH